MQDCKDIQQMIVPFASGRLSLKNEENFVRHLAGCADCREEFEIYYIIAYGLSDEEEEAAIQPEYRALLERYDFKGLVDLKLKNSVRKTEKIRRINKISTACWCFTNLCMLLTVLFLMIIRYY